MLALIVATMLSGAPVTAAKPIPAGAIITRADLVVAESEDAAILAGALEGKAARRLLVAGAAVTTADAKPPTLVERNGLVILEYVKGPLVIIGRGRALDAGGANDLVRVMNIDSRAVVAARVAGPQRVRIDP